MNTQTQETLKIIESAEWLADKIVTQGDYAKEASLRLKQLAQMQREALAQPAQEPVACDGKFPENFDASLGIPAQYLRLANGIMMDYMGKRSWDVPMCATAIMEFINTHPAPSWQGLSDDEAIQIYISDPAIASYDDPKLIKYARAIEQALRNKNDY